MQPLKTLKPFELAWRIMKNHSNLWMLLVRFQEKKESFVSENVVIGQFSFKCLRFNVRTLLKSQKSQEILFWESEILSPRI